MRTKDVAGKRHGITPHRKASVVKPGEALQNGDCVWGGGGGGGGGAGGGGGGVLENAGEI